MSKPEAGRGRRYLFHQLDELDPKPCPCGLTRRGFLDDPDATASTHIVDIKTDAQTHYHKKLTEIYFILEGEGTIELDGERLPVRRGSAVMIKPGCRHRAVGKLRLLVTAIPKFDPADEWV
ncbi:MAG TPA: cupin domain-containing protein [Candidatus Brocadiia bacterium]|nr:cupin domain-containing protein [Candidatus Brocadiia bacterium]